MRIVYVTAELPFSTQEAFIIPEVVELIRRGHEVRIVPRSPRASVAHEDAAALLSHTVRQPIISVAILLAVLQEVCRSPIRSMRAIAWLFQSRNVAVLARNLAVAPKALWLSRIARQWGASHIHAHWAATTSTMAMIASEVCGIPWSFTGHRWDIVENNLLALKIRKTGLARFISRSGTEMARNVMPDGVPDKARIIHMGVQLPLRSETGRVHAGPPTVLCAANLLPVKGHRYLIEAFAILKARGVDAALWIAGEGEMRESIEHQVATLSLQDRVVMLGQVSHKSLLAMYAERKIDVVVLPSVDLGNGLHEGIPVALIEAMGYRIATVSTLTGGIPELLDKGAGMLVPARDCEALADALECLLLHPVRRAQVGLAGRNRVEQQFCIEAVVTELSAHFTAPDRSINEQRA